MYTMHYDHSHKTAVPTELLQDPYLSVDTKGLAAILCSFGKERLPHRSSGGAIRFPSNTKKTGSICLHRRQERSTLMTNTPTVPIHLKMALTTKEAAEYSNIGINKIDSMLKAPNCPFALFVGTKKLVKRREFEEYISARLVI